MNKVQKRTSISKTRGSFYKALLYGIRAYVSYFLMMVFMTYNGYFMSSIIAGFFIGHFIISLMEPDKKSNSAIYPPCPCC